MMEKLIQNLLFKKNVKPPQGLISLLNEMFPDSKNIEWNLRNNKYEAIFYSNNIEHIAHFDKNGSLIDYRINLPPNGLPENIAEVAHKKGEIMNVVAIHSNDEITYEIIFRDLDLTRYVLNVNQHAIIISEKVL